LKDTDILELRCGYCAAPINSNGLKCKYCETEHVRKHEPITLGVMSTGSYPFGSFAFSGVMMSSIPISISGGRPWVTGDLMEDMKDSRWHPMLESDPRYQR